MVTPPLTKNQSLVMGALAHSDGPMSAYTILDKLRDMASRAAAGLSRARQAARIRAGSSAGEPQRLRGLQLPA